MQQAFRRFIKDERAAALIEFAFCLPVLLILAFVILEFSMLQMARIKVDKASYQINSVLTQMTRGEQTSPGNPNYFTLDSAQVNTVLDRVDRMLPRFTRGGAKVVVSGFTYADRVYPAGSTVAQPMNAPVFLWAVGRVFGDNPPDSASTVAMLGSNISWASGLQMQPVTFTDPATQAAITTYGTFRCPENVILVEVFYDYTPLFPITDTLSFIDRHTLKSRSFLRPRTGDVEAIAGDASFSQPAASYHNTKRNGGFCNL